MILVPEGALEYGRIKSEGKILEIIPVITDACGQPMVLPPVNYHVENWLLGYKDHHPQGMPISYTYPGKIVLIGSTPSLPHQLSFLVRVLEDGGESPEGLPVGNIDAAAVKELIDAIKEAAKPS